MRLVQFREDMLEIRWTWLPYWLAVNPKLVSSVETDLADAVVINRLTNSEEDLQRMHVFVVKRLCKLFNAFKGLEAYLNALEAVEEPVRS